MKERLRRLERLRNLEVCLVAPAIEPGWNKAFVVSAGRVCAVHTLPPGATPPACRRAPSTEEPLTPEQAEDLLLIGGFVHRPPPELKVLSASLPRKRFNERGAGGSPPERKEMR